MDRMGRCRRIRAQSSVLGVVLILGLTMTVASSIVVLGGAVLDDSQQRAQLDQAEQALTQFDSRAAQVALGESSSQTVRVGRSNGDYRIRPDAGHVTITHVNYTDSENQTIHEGPLGALVYTQGDTEIAYQGGGVWRRDGDGGATMISPPEFHYRRATLTFPIVRVVGDGAASGDVTARVERSQPPQNVFPNRTESYDQTDDEYLNPVENGTMMVTVQSEYCQGWKRYFDARTEGNVTACNDGEVTAEIVSIGTQGEFDIANQPQLRIRGVEDLLELKLVFRDSSEQNSEFNNFEWSMAAEEGDQQLEFYIHNEDRNVKCDDPDKDTANATVEIYYSDDGGDTYSTWVNNDTRDDFQIVCDSEGQVLVVDLLDEDAPMDHVESDVYASSGGGDSIPVFANDATDFNQTVPAGMDDPEDVENVTKHYMEKMGDADFDIQEQNMAGIGSDSKGNIEYEGTGRVITFLHITENEIEIELR